MANVGIKCIHSFVKLQFISVICFSALFLILFLDLFVCFFSKFQSDEKSSKVCLFSAEGFLMIVYLFLRLEEWPTKCLTSQWFLVFSSEMQQGDEQVDELFVFSIPNTQRCKRHISRKGVVEREVKTETSRSRNDFCQRRPNGWITENVHGHCSSSSCSSLIVSFQELKYNPHR